MTEYEYHVPNLGYKLLSFYTASLGVILGTAGTLVYESAIPAIVGAGVSTLGGWLYLVVKHEKPKDLTKRSGLERRVAKNPKSRVHKRKVRPGSHPPKQGPRT